jgi:hypothetical protein
MPDSSLTYPQRAELIIRLMKSLFEREWDVIDVILTSFDLRGLSLEDGTPYGEVSAQCRASLQNADSSTLRQLASYVLGPEIVSPVLQSQPADHADDLWEEGIVRIFLSHLAAEREFVGEVNKELKGIGLSSFVAHDSIDVSQEWQAEIERALRTADVLVGLAHPNFTDSVWTQQEVGWALGRDIPVLLIGIGETPRGFPARYQAPMLGQSHRTAWRVASTIAVWLTRQDRWGSAVVNALVHDLEYATSYVAGRDAAERLEQVGRLTPAVLDAIEHAYLSNNQLYPSHIGSQAIQRILEAHGRTLPRDKAFLGPGHQ